MITHCDQLTRLSGSVKLTVPTNASTWLCSLIFEGVSMIFVGASFTFSKSMRNCRLILYPLPPTSSVQFTCERNHNVVEISLHYKFKTTTYCRPYIFQTIQLWKNIIKYWVINIYILYLNPHFSSKLTLMLWNGINS